ncbi:hypothetical protein [Fodinicola feengrottensis]|nr:hypothetical protein [Fodinicola feengrottensis]
MKVGSSAAPPAITGTATTAGRGFHTRFSRMTASADTSEAKMSQSL